MIKHFDAYVEQIRFDTRWGEERAMIRNVHYGKYYIRDHIWIKLASKKLRKAIHERLRKTIRFRAESFLYFDIETGKKSKIGLKSIRDISISKLNLRKMQ